MGFLGDASKNRVTDAQPTEFVCSNMRTAFQRKHMDCRLSLYLLPTDGYRRTKRAMVGLLHRFRSKDRRLPATSALDQG